MKRFLYFALFFVSFAVTQKLSAQDIRLREGDTLEIRIGGVPSEEIGQVSGTYTVDGEGNVNMPHVGRVKAAGTTQSQLQQSIEGAYKGQKIYTNPSITVQVQQSSRFVNLGGAVRSPGRIPFTADLTVTSAINAAGGFTEFANQTQIRMTRDGKTQNLSMKAIRKDPSLDLHLKPGDTLEVMQSFW
ncbi:MAG: polysaccharide biosynthesis/export family protein [Chthoniobacterales bacterium]